MKKIISGGQTGADQGGLEAGEILGVATGGTAPYSWLTDEGTKPELLKFYGLVEGPYDPKKFSKRTIMNVENSDGTVWFGRTESPGGKLTLNTAARLRKPCIVNPRSSELADWVKSNQIETLNVAGNRERTNPGIRVVTRRTLVEALTDG